MYRKQILAWVARPSRKADAGHLAGSCSYVAGPRASILASDRKVELFRGTLRGIRSNPQELFPPELQLHIFPARHGHRRSAQVVDPDRIRLDLRLRRHLETTKTRSAVFIALFLVRRFDLRDESERF